MRPVTLNPQNTIAALREIESASHQNDTTEIAQAFSITGTFTNTFNLNVTSPTAANIAAVLATLISVLQRGGVNRTT